MKRSFACLVFALLLLLAGCGEAVESSEVFAFPEPTTQIKVKRVTSWGEETEFMFGPDVYDPENREVVPVIQWFYALGLEKSAQPEDVDGNVCYEFYVDGKHAFRYDDRGGEAYIVAEEDWYRVKKPTAPPVE